MSWFSKLREKDAERRDAEAAFLKTPAGGVTALVVVGVILAVWFWPAGMPACNDAWVEQASLEWYKESTHEGLVAVYGANVADTFVGQSFRLENARTVERDESVDRAVCSVELYGRKLAASGGLQEQVEWITQLSYEVYLNEDGEPYVSSLD